MGKPARTLTLAIESLLTLKRWMVIKPGSGCARNRKGDFYRIGQPGVSDIIAWKPKPGGGVYLICCEVKAGKDRVSDAQSAWLGKAAAQGAFCIVARSCEDVEQRLQEL
jgi:hypothetical protein